MADEKKSSGEGSKEGSKEGSGDRESRFFEGKASRTGEEGIFLQPTGSHDSDPFIEPATQPEASNPAQSAESEPSNGGAGDTGQASQAESKEGAPDSKAPDSK